MSSHVDPTKDKYFELEKTLGTGEYELAADIAAGNKALDDAVKTAREHAAFTIGDVHRSRGKEHG